MPKPQHPDNVLVKNKYYSRGLNEASVYNYYVRNKGLILDQVKNKDLMFFIMTDVNTPIVQRKGKQTRFIRLNNSNYDDVLHGRVISIHTAMNRSQSYGIIDIDTDDFHRAREATIDVFNFVRNDMHPVIDTEIRYTGKGGFHVICHFSRNMNIDSIRYLLYRYLIDSELAKKYTIAYKRSPGKVNLDISSNKFRGNHIVLHALSVRGLKCMELNVREVSSFDPSKATIKTIKGNQL